jgi:DNA-binding MarR family transcriptional regulator
LTKRNWPQGRFDTPGQSPGFLLWQATNRWQRLIRAALAPFGVTHVQFVLLAGIGWLEHSEGDVAITQKRLSEHCATDPMMTSQVLRTLEQEGHVARTRDPDDARAWLLALTDGGYRKLVEALPAVENADASFFSRVEPRQDALQDCLRRLMRP